MCVFETHSSHIFPTPSEEHFLCASCYDIPFNFSPFCSPSPFCCVCVCADYSRQVQEEVVAQSRAYDELLKTLSRTSNGYSAQLSPSSSRLSLSLGSPP